MPQLLNSFPESRRKQATGRKSNFPWDDWLDGRIWQLSMAEDFIMTPSAFTTIAARAALLRGLALRLVETSRTEVALQAQRVSWEDDWRPFSARNESPSR